jgi:phytoene/squalene synthetase
MHIEEDIKFCAETALRLDPERHLMALLAAREAQSKLMTLLAWNGELGQIAPRVREPMAGAMRFEWWREILRAERRPDGPLARALLNASLPVDELMAIIDGRMRDLDHRPFADIDELSAYAEATGGGLARLLMVALGGHDEGEQMAARHVGSAWALLGLLRSALQLAREGRSVLPGLEANEVLANNKVARDAACQVSLRAKALLAIPRSRIRRERRPALLVIVPARDFLRLLSENDHDLADQRLANMRRSAPLRMLLATWLGRT